MDPRKDNLSLLCNLHGKCEKAQKGKVLIFLLAMGAAESIIWLLYEQSAEAKDLTQCGLCPSRVATNK